ncbi:hypothetical protein Tco_0359018 [Tanacetum coccineum]
MENHDGEPKCDSTKKETDVKSPQPSRDKKKNPKPFVLAKLFDKIFAFRKKNKNDKNLDAAKAEALELLCKIQETYEEGEKMLREARERLEAEQISFEAENIVGKKKCDEFWWIDPEISSPCCLGFLGSGRFWVGFNCAFLCWFASFLGIKGHLPLFVLVKAYAACDGIVLKPAPVFEPGVACDGIVLEPNGVGGGGIVLEPDGGGIMFEVDGDGVGGGGIVFEVDGVGGGGIVFKVDGVAVAGGMLLDGAS